MQWEYFIQYNKNADGALKGIMPTKRLLDDNQVEIATQTVGFEEFTKHAPAEYVVEFYTTLRAELSNTLDVLMPIGPQPETLSESYRMSTNGLVLGQVVSYGMAIGLSLYEKGKMTQNDQ